MRGRFPVEEVADEGLVRRTRAGDAAAYDELWRRHAAAASAVARSFASFEPEELLSEGYTRVLGAIRRGGGPSGGFRPYLVTTVKDVAREWSRRDHDVATAGLETDAGPAECSGEERAIAALERGTTASAFRSLPSRWQEVLWYSEVEGMTPRELAPLLGLSPNATSAVLVRAKHAFRETWVERMVADAAPSCRPVLARLGDGRRLSEPDRRSIGAHLAGCERCAIAWEESGTAASRLGLVLLPISAGLAGGAAYAAWLRAGSPEAPGPQMPQASAGASTSGTGAVLQCPP